MFKLNQKGMSLIEVIVAMAISSIVSLAVMKTNESSIKTSNKSTSDFALQNFQQMALSLPLSDPANCSANFGGIDPTVKVEAVNFVSSNNIINGSGTLFSITAPNNTTKDGTWRLDDMWLDPFVANVSSNIGICNLKVKVTRLKKAFGPKDKIINVPLTCTLSGTNEISACSAGGTSDSNVWTLQFDSDGYEFAQYLPSGSQPGYVLIGPDPNTNVAPETPEEVDAPLYINMEGKPWLGDASLAAAIKLKDNNGLSWSEWINFEGRDSDFVGLDLTAGTADDIGPDLIANTPDDKSEKCWKVSGWNGSGVTNYVQTCRNETRIRHQLKAYGDTTIYDSSTPTNHLSMGRWWASGDSSSFLSFNFYRNLWAPATGASPWMMTHNFNRMGTAGVDDGGGLILNNKTNGGFEFYSVPAGAAVKTTSTALDDLVFNVNQAEANFHSKHAANGTRNYSFGPFNLNNGISGFAVGDSILNDANYATSFGKSILNEGDVATALGINLIVTGNYSFAAGEDNAALGTSSTVLGSSNQANGNFSSVLGGRDGLATAIDSTVVGGNSNQARGNGSFAAGYESRAYGKYSVAIGYQVEAGDSGQVNQDPDTSFNAACTSSNRYTKNDPSNTALWPPHCHDPKGFKSIAIGNGSKAKGSKSIAIGGMGGDYAAVAEGDSSIAIGKTCYARGQGSMCFGNSNSAFDSGVIPGSSPPPSAEDVGGSTSAGRFSIAIGGEVQAFGDKSIVIGKKIETSGENTVIIGNSPYAIYHTETENELHLFSHSGVHMKSLAGDVEIVARGNSGAPSFTEGTDVTPLGTIRLKAGSVLLNSGASVSSDKRLKNDINYSIAENDLAKILQLKPAAYSYKKDIEHRKRLGLIAQDVKEVFPETVITDDETGFFAVNYSDLISPIVSSIKSLYSKIVELFERTDGLESKFERLELRLNKLEQENKQLKDKLKKSQQK